MAERNLSSQEIFEALNYLGRPVGVALQGATGLADAPGGLPSAPATGAGLGMEGPIETPGQVGAPPPATSLGDLGTPGAGPSSMGVGAPESGGSASRAPSLPSGQGSNLADILEALQKTGKVLGDLFPASQPPSHGMDPETRAAFEEQRAGERDMTLAPTASGGETDFTNMQRFGEFGEIVPPMDLGGGLDFTNMQNFGEFGELAGSGGLPISIASGTAERVPGVLNNLGELPALAGQVASILGPIAGGTTSLISALNANNDFDRAMGGVNMALYGLAPMTGGVTAGVAAALQAIDAIVGGITGSSVGQHLGFAPSNEWLSFAPRLADTVQYTNTAMTDLANNIMSAQTPGDLAGVAQGYRSAIGSRVGGFGQDAGVWDLPTPPGATGTEHEGNIRVDYGELMPPLQTLLQTRLAMLQNPSAENQAAHQAALRAIQPAFQNFEGKWWPAPVDWAERNRQMTAEAGLPPDYATAIESGGGA